MSCDKCGGCRVRVHDEQRCMNCGKRWFEPWPVESRDVVVAWWRGNYEKRGYKKRAHGPDHGRAIREGMRAQKMRRSTA